MSAEARLIKFIESDRASAFVLRGTWGRGKTHLWKAVVDEQAKSSKVRPQRYAYVSLFGVNNLDALKDEIFIAARQLREPEEPGWLRSNLRRRGKDAKGLVKEAINPDIIPYAATIKRVAHAIAFRTLHDMLICLDDIERRGAGLDLKDVMGLISMLCEERNCRVLVILNDRSLGKDTPTWNEHKEKVFLGEIEFDPAPQQCIDLVFKPELTDEYAVAAKGAMLDLKLTNIRIIERVRSALDQVHEALGNARLSTYTKHRIARTLTWAVYCHSGHGEGAPPIERSRHARVLRLMLANPKDTRSDEERGWDAVIEQFNPNLDTSLDGALLEMIAKGHADTALVKRGVELFERNVEAEKARQAFDDVWDDFHNVFADNRDEVVSKFRENFDGAKGAIDQNSLDAVILLLRQIGEGRLADDFISRWVAARCNERIDELDMRTINPSQFSRVRDPAFATAIDEAFRTHHKPLPLKEALVLLAGTPTRQRDLAIEALALTSASDLARHLIEHPGEDNARAIRFCLDLPMGHEQYPIHDKAGHVVRDALISIAKTSDFNRFRIERNFKITPHHSSTAEGYGVVAHRAPIAPVAPEAGEGETAKSG